MKHQPRHLLQVLALGALALVVAGTQLSAQFSSATLTSSSGNTATVSAAADWTPPSVQINAPGTTIQGTVTVSATATDGETGISTVVIERMAPGTNTWVALCTTTSAPFSCTWDTTSLPDGQHALRAHATDGAGHRTTSDVVRTVVANNLSVILRDPGDFLRGTVPLQATVVNAPSTSHTVRIEYAAIDSSTWRQVCAPTAPGHTCNWNTTSVSSGDYQLRAVVVRSGVLGTTLAISEIFDVVIDNVAPTVTLRDPGTPLSGTRTFRADATDEHTDVDRVEFQQATSASGPWRTLCTADEEPWTCRIDTSSLRDGAHHFRAVATDEAGNLGTSATVGPRTVDNTVASVSVDVPNRLTGTVTLGAAASSTAGVAAVRIQYAPQGSTTWTTVCTDTAVPWGCAWDTNRVADGQYIFRAILVDSLGRELVSAVDGPHQVDNAPLRSVDVQAYNNGSTVGRIEPGDSMIYTWSTEIDPTSVLAGWNGSSRTVTVRVRDGALLGRGSKGDTLDVLVGKQAINLGDVNLKGNYVTPLATREWSATMSLGPVAGPGGTVRSTVTLQLGQMTSFLKGVRTAPSTGAMVWTPSTAVKDLANRNASGAAVTETGPADKEF